MNNKVQKNIKQNCSSNKNIIRFYHINRIPKFHKPPIRF